METVILLFICMHDKFKKKGHWKQSQCVGIQYAEHQCNADTFTPVALNVCSLL